MLYHIVNESYAIQFQPSPSNTIHPIQSIKHRSFQTRDSVWRLCFQSKSQVTQRTSNAGLCRLTLASHRSSSPHRAPGRVIEPSVALCMATALSTPVQVLAMHSFSACQVPGTQGKPIICASLFCFSISVYIYLCIYIYIYILLYRFV